jgi:hypothetical protein
MEIIIREIICCNILLFCLNLNQVQAEPTPYNLEYPPCNRIIDSLPNAGIISISNRQLCPKELLQIKVDDYNPLMQQFLLIASKEGIFTQAKKGDLWNYAFAECGSYYLLSLNTQDNIDLDTLIGLSISDLSPDNCKCDISTLTIEVKYTSAPTFDIKPADITVTCIQSPLSYSDGLPYTDPCGNQGLAPLITKSKNPCDYGLNSRVWQINDGCGFPIIHTQKITNNHSNIIPSFINPPANLTVSCSRNDIIIPNLTILNYTQFCNIDLSIAPKVESNPSPCGGTITAWWTYTDACNRTITHSQSITKTPMSLASFINPPSDITLSCGMKPVIDSLAYSNGSSECILQGKVPPQVKGDPSKCEPVTITWLFTDECQRTITHQQSITWTTNQKNATEKRAYLHANEVKPQKEIRVVWE